MVEAAALLDRAHAQVTETDMGYGAALAGCPGCRLGPGVTTRHGLHGTTYPRDQPRGGKRIRQVDSEPSPTAAISYSGRGPCACRWGNSASAWSTTGGARPSTSRVACSRWPVSYTHLRAHETRHDL